MNSVEGENRNAEVIAELRRALRSRRPSDRPSRPPPALGSPEQHRAVLSESVLSTTAYTISKAALVIADEILRCDVRAVDGILAEAEGPDSRAELCVAVGGAIVPVLGEGLVLGRRPGSSGAIVGDPQVSRRHARIERSGCGLVVSDLGSVNGTMIVRQGMEFPVGAHVVRLESGDRIITIRNVLLAEVLTRADSVG